MSRKLCQLSYGPLFSKTSKTAMTLRAFAVAKRTRQTDKPNEQERRHTPGALGRQGAGRSRNPCPKTKNACFSED